MALLFLCSIKIAKDANKTQQKDQNNNGNSHLLPWPCFAIHKMLDAENTFYLLNHSTLYHVHPVVYAPFADEEAEV